MRGLTDLIAPFTQLLPPWALAILAIVVAFVAVPRWWASMRDKQVQGLLRRAARATPEDRPALIEEAFARAADAPDRLYTLARHAHERQLPDAHQRALAALDRTPQGRRLHRLLDRQLGRTDDRGPTAFERAATVRALLDEDRLPEARVRLDDALARFPDDPDLRALDEDVTGRMLDGVENQR